MEITEKDKKLVEKYMEIAEMGMGITEMDVKSVQDARLIAELKEFTKDKFWITDIYKLDHTSGLSTGIMDEIIGNDE